MSETALAKTATQTPLRQVIGWFVAGHSDDDILDAIAQHFPGEKVKPLIVSAMKHFEEAGEADPKLYRGLALECTRDVLRRTLEVGDHGTALRAIKMLSELAGK